VPLANSNSTEATSTDNNFNGFMFGPFVAVEAGAGFEPATSILAVVSYQAALPRSTVWAR
jgi:hypothetical protein